MQLQKLKIGKWIAKESRDSIFLGSQVKIFRNLADYKFRSKITLQERKEIFNLVYDLYKRNPDLRKGDFIELKNLTQIERLFLIEENYLDSNKHDFTHMALILFPSICASILINGDEHITITVNSSTVEKAYKYANFFDDIFSKYLPIAFNDKLGFLTSSADYLSNGVKILSFVHFGAARRLKKLPSIIADAEQKNYILKEYHNFDIVYFYEFINSGFKFFLNSEKEILKIYTNDLAYFILKENEARKNIIEKQYYILEDELWRIIGILKYAKLLDIEESFYYLASLLFGNDAGVFKMDVDKIKKLIVLIQPGHLRAINDSIKEIKDETAFRAEIIRKELNL